MEGSARARGGDEVLDRGDEFGRVVTDAACGAGRWSSRFEVVLGAHPRACHPAAVSGEWRAVIEGGPGRRWHRGRVERVIVAIVVAGCLLAIASATAGAATISVTTTADTLTGGQCSLRAALAAANTDAPVAGCTAGAGSDTIMLPSGDYRLAIAPSGSDDNSSGDLDIASNVTIDGAGAASTTVDGGGLDRVFSVDTGALVTISGVTITGGHASDGGPGGPGVAVARGRPDQRRWVR